MNTDPLNNFPIVLYDPQQGRGIPETFVRSALDEYANYSLFGDDVEITGGFMEPSGHGDKNQQAYVIFENDPNNIVSFPDTLISDGQGGYTNDNYNIGIDYTVNTADELTRSWYSGEVVQAGLEGGYGNRVHVKTDVTYEFDGREYDVYTAYAHLDSIDVQVGDRVNQGDNLGEMGGTGSGGVTRYDPHVDLQTWIQLDDGRKVNLSPNLLQKQLAERFCHQYGPPTLGVIARQNSLPPGVLESWSGGCTPPSPPHAEDAEDGFELAEGQIRRRFYDPLVLDLDGDGIELSALDNTSVYFDIDGDGFREKTGWVSSDDGFLVLDRNNDGYINDISEIFGSPTVNGFDELRELDSNNDNQITAADTRFAELQVWRDLDEDGRSDVNELYSLAELNITKINTVYDPADIDREGNLINGTASFELADGTQQEAASILLNTDQFDAYYDHNSTFNDPIVITEQILNLPNLRGYGELPDLRIAMAKDSQLLSLVESFVEHINPGNVSTADELVRSILMRWASIEETDDSNSFDLELEFLEKFVGRDWNNDNPSDAGRQTIQNTYAQLSTELEKRLLVQILDLPVNYDPTSEQFTFTGEIADAIELLDRSITQSQTSPSDFLTLEAEVLTDFINQEGEGKYILGTIDDNQLSGGSIIYGFVGNDTLNGGYGDDAYYGGDGNDLLSDSYNNNLSDSDTLDGGTGNDTLIGGGGNDTYIFNRGYGQDLISDYGTFKSAYQAARTTDGGASDTLVFGSGITRNNLTWNFDGKDLIFTLTESTDDSLTIQNYHNSIYRIENFEVEGSELTVQEIIGSQIWSDTTATNSLSWLSSNISYKALGGDDTITTGDYNDKIWGQAGNDSITSGGGNDTLVGSNGNDILNAGEGNDFVYGGNDNDTLNGGNGNNYLEAGSGNDSLVAGSGLDTLDGGADNDTLNGGYGDDAYYGGDGSDILSDSYNNNLSDSDTLDGGTGNDTLIGGGGNDTYIFNRGYGQDLISDYGTFKSAYQAARTTDGGASDTLVFGSGITRNNLTWNFDGADLVFSLNNSPNDSLIIENYTDNIYKIENIEVDGTLLTSEEIFNPQFD